MSESKEQQLLVQWFRYQYPDKIIFAIPNAQLAGASRLQKYKNEGLLPGVSDLFIAVPTHSLQGFGEKNNAYAGLFLEMKDKGMTQCSLRDNQKQFMEDVEKAGYKACWAAGFEEAKEIIEDYLKEG